MDLSNGLTEKTVRLIPSKNSLTTKEPKQLKRMGVDFSENTDALYEYHRNYEKDEIWVRHMGLSPPDSVEDVEWFLRPREMQRNQFVKKVIFQGDTVYLNRAFEYTSTMPNLNRVQFLLGRRETEHFHYNFGLSEIKNIPTNINVSELIINVDWYNYNQDTEKGKEITKKLILATLRTAKLSYPMVRILRFSLPKYEEMLDAIESIWHFYFPNREFNYKTDIKSGISMINGEYEEKLCILPSPPTEQNSPCLVQNSDLISLAMSTATSTATQPTSSSGKIRRISSVSSLSSQTTTDALSDQYSNISADEYDPAEDVLTIELKSPPKKNFNEQRHDKIQHKDGKETKNFKRPLNLDDNSPPPLAKKPSLEELEQNQAFVRPPRRARPGPVIFTITSSTSIPSVPSAPPYSQPIQLTNFWNKYLDN